MHPPSGLASAVVEHLFRKADAERWGLTREEFALRVNASVAHAFRAGSPSPPDLDRYVAALHAADLALAHACGLGRDTAWEHFILQHRPVLYRAADALDPTGGAREAADSLYADLYAIDEAGKERRSLLRYFHGRSSLATWLRAVLAQRYVDAIRARKHLVPLPDDGASLPRLAGAEEDPDRARLVRLVERALKAAIDELAPRDRLRLRSYYVTQLTLAQIGAMMGEHEATVSRHLSRTRRSLREGLKRHLREDGKLTAAQVARAVELALEDPGGIDLHHLIELERKNAPPDRST